MKIIFLSSYDGDRFIKRSPDLDNDSFFTYGFNGRRARNLKKFFPDYDVEVWRFSINATGYFEKTIENILFKVYPAFRLKYIIDVSFKGMSDLLKLSRKEPVLIYSRHVHRTLIYLVSFLFKNFPIIVQDHGEFPPKTKSLSKNIFKKIYYKFNFKIEKLVFKNIDFFCLGDVNKIEFIREVFPEFQGEVTPSIGIDTNVFCPINKKVAKQKLGWDINKKYILLVGRLDIVKNVAELINAWIEIKKEMPEVELVFIGGMESDPFYNLAVQSNAIMYSRMKNTDLPLFYSAADVFSIFALENIKFGGMGIAVAESLACGTPVVSGGLRNILGGNLEGIGEAPQTLEEHKVALAKVLQNLDKYTACRDVILKYYTEEAIAIRLDQVIKQILSKYPHIK